jgi:uncharacterized ion transporter superfamily protein YfcC
MNPSQISARTRFCLSKSGRLVISRLELRAQMNENQKQPALELLAGFKGLLAAAAEQVFFLFVAGGVAGAVSVSGQFHSGLHSHAIVVFLDA